MIDDKEAYRWAQNSHWAGGGFWQSILVILLCPQDIPMPHIWHTLGIAMVITALKEFVYDNIWETAEERGSNWEDWFNYQYGLWGATAVCYAKHVAFLAYWYLSK